MTERPHVAPAFKHGEQKRDANRAERTTVGNRSPRLLRLGATGDSAAAAMTWGLAKHASLDGSRQIAGIATSRERDGLLQAAIEARAALEEAVVAAAMAAQRARSLTVALEALVGQAVPETAPDARAPRLTQAIDGVDALSAREWEVLALLAEGYSNKAIADALYVSPNTIKTHVAALLHKLHADSRVQLAVIAARQWCSRTAWPSGGGREMAG